MKTTVIATAAMQSGNEECPFWGLYAVATTAVPDLGRKRLMGVTHPDTTRGDQRGALRLVVTKKK